MNGNRAKKLIVVGLDGATFDVLDPYFERGDMPNLRMLCTQGVRGPLNSSIPPVTGPSWVSFMTGKNPGKHGIFDFVKARKDAVGRYPVNYRHIRSKTIWSLLSEAGLGVGTVNMPLTYPPPEINGFVITGLLTPSDADGICYPEGLMAELRDRVGPYTIDVWWQYYGEAGVERFLDDLIRCTEQRIRAIDYLMKNREWDLFVPVFIGTDRIQHFLWRYIHPRNPSILSQRERGFVSRIRDYYNLVDAWIGKVVEGWGKEANIVLISDHGFGPLTGKVYVNWWLYNKGYLGLNHGKRGLHLFLRHLGLALKKKIRRIDRLNLRKLFKFTSGGDGRMGAYDFLKAIDWSKTTAYSASNTEQGIYINLEGREPHGIVNIRDYEKVRDKIIEDLKTLRHPEDGEPLVSHIYKKEELYSGPFIHEAPDIVFFLRGGEILVDVQLKGRIYEEASWISGWGTHRMEGVFIGCGPDLRKGTSVEGINIMDIAPTILRLLGLPIPRDMDGRVIEEAIEERFLKSSKAIYTDGEGTVAHNDADGVLTREDEEEVEKRLKGLGYL